MQKRKRTKVVKQEIKHDENKVIEKSKQVFNTKLMEDMICIPTIGGDDMYIRKESYERSIANKKQIIENSKISEMTADSINGVIIQYELNGNHF